MPRPKALSEEEEFEVYYRSRDAPEPLSTREVVRLVLNDRFSAMIVSDTLKRMDAHFAASDDTAKAYAAWKEGKRERKSLFDIGPDGKWTSPFPSVTSFMSRQADKETWEKTLQYLDKFYRFTGYKAPQNWTAADVNAYKNSIPTKSVKMRFLIEVRRIEPRFKFDSALFSETGTPGDYKELNVKRYYLDSTQIVAGLVHMEKLGMRIPAFILRTHLDLGCREGSEIPKRTQKRGGLLGLKWDGVNWSNAGREGRPTMDVYENKTKGGVTWKDCPLDLFGWRVYELMRKMRGTVDEFRVGKEGTLFKYDGSGDSVIGISYKGLLAVWGVYGEVLRSLYPDAKFDAVTPHTGRHLHVNLLVDRGIDSMTIAGDGKAGVGVVGVGWETLDVLHTYYMSLMLNSPMAKAQAAASIEENPQLALRRIAEAKGAAV